MGPLMKDLVGVEEGPKEPHKSSWGYGEAGDPVRDKRRLANSVHCFRFFSRQAALYKMVGENSRAYSSLVE
jgi:hypothetical protein